MKKIILIFTLLIIIKGFSQEKSFTDTMINFVIKERQLVSKNYTDEINNLNSKLPRGQWEGEKLNIDAPPPLPHEVSFDFKRFIHFTITPQHYIQYNIVNNVFENDTLYGPATTEIKKINREDLSVSEFIPLWFTTRTSKLYKMDACNYNIITEFRNIKKNISGYNCFKVILESETNPYDLLELYVTEDINLNYNPVINCKEILTKYYPLYLKKYRKKYPDDNFREYTFVKSN
ncbi:hypothetical protein D7030_07540 [Flavobacteriaceae bacterium AU392]|nr:hypothetical protein D1817_00880 [Flavobacteriaceae bacterium]RKM84975.1 hypothetical protein D7030_07540 [Flavobacteriaceae bacterium AU392]